MDIIYEIIKFLFFISICHVVIYNYEISLLKSLFEKYKRLHDGIVLAHIRNIQNNVGKIVIKWSFWYVGFYCILYSIIDNYEMNNLIFYISIFIFCLIFVYKVNSYIQKQVKDLEKKFDVMN